MLALVRGEANRAVRLLEESLESAPPTIRVYRLRTLAQALQARGSADDLGRARVALAEALAAAGKMGDVRRAAQLRGDIDSLP